MDGIPRFCRKKEMATPIVKTTPTNDARLGRTTPPPSDVQPAPPGRPSQKLSALSRFRRGPAKRARDVSPASMSLAPSALPPGLHGNSGQPLSPVSPSVGIIQNGGSANMSASMPPKIPQFLRSTRTEVVAKFHELTWLERERVAEARSNPSPDFKWAHVQGPTKLDRYQNIQPWNNHRIRLQVPDGHVDYINASPITLEPLSHDREPSLYIAMQGPKQITTDHAWRMVTEQLESPGVIVMLTETHEGHMEKCYAYFPRLPGDPPLLINGHDEFGDGFRASVYCESIEDTPAGDAIELRKLVVQIHAHARSGSERGEQVTSDGTLGPTAEDIEDVQMSSTGINAHNEAAIAANTSHGRFPGAADTDIHDLDEHQNLEVLEERVVWHFLYKKWPDFGTPAIEDLDSFLTLMRLSREKNSGPHNPRIVHCSAGVGRSGTFITLDHLMSELEAGALEHHDEEPATPPHGADKGTAVKQGQDVIFATVNRLREQRRTMVQAEPQYLFVYQVMRKLWQNKYPDEEEVGEPAAKRLEFDPFGP